MRKTARNIALAACLGGVLAAVVPSSAILAAEEETSKDVIAVQIKKQGYTCNNPEKATRDKERSKPDRTVWLLICESGTYRVRLVPDMAAQVELLD